jgi:uncharacterized protein (TIRG00374 family)
VRRAVVLGTNLAAGAGALGYALYRFGAPALALLASRPRGLVLLAFAAAVAAAFLGFALRWRHLLAGLGPPPSLRALAAYRAAGQSLAALVPGGRLGGDPLRAFLLAADGAPGANAIASVTVDRALEVGAGVPFACLYAALLLRRGVPELEGALVAVVLGAAGLVFGLALVVRRLRRGAGLVTALARSTGLDRLRRIHGQMNVLAAAEEAMARLVAQPRRLVQAFGAGVGVNLLVLVEYRLLLSAFGLPAEPLAVVAAIFATGASHSLPVPAGIGVLEGAQMWIFGTLGYPPEVGLAVGLAVRLRELAWTVPGLCYLVGHGLAARRSPFRVLGPAAIDRAGEEAGTELAEPREVGHDSDFRETGRLERPLPLLRGEEPRRGAGFRVDLDVDEALENLERELRSDRLTGKRP